MRVPRQERVRDVLIAHLELPLVFHPGRCTRSGREEKCIGSVERDRVKPTAKLATVCVSAVQYVSSDTELVLEGTTERDQLSDSSRAVP